MSCVILLKPDFIIRPVNSITLNFNILYSFYSFYFAADKFYTNNIYNENTYKHFLYGTYDYCPNSFWNWWCFFYNISFFLLIIISKVDNNLKYKVMCQQICIYIIVKTVYLLSQKWVQIYETWVDLIRSDHQTRW